jgi:hypothetical protein
LASPETSPYKSEHIQDLLNHWPQSGDGRNVTLTAKDAIAEFKRSNFSPTTLGHELVHRIQEAIVRRFGHSRELYRPVWVPNASGEETQLHNYNDAVYLGAGRVAFVPCPDGITLRDIARNTPQSLRDQMYYKGYVQAPSESLAQNGTITSAQPPNFLINELSSRHLGAKMALELKEETNKYNATQQDKVSFSPGLEPLIVYTLLLAVEADKHTHTFKDEHDRQQFFGVIRYLVERCVHLDAIFSVREDFKGYVASASDNHFEIFSRSQDCAELRAGVERIFGRELLDKVMFKPAPDELLVAEPMIEEIPINSLTYLENLK